ncbi:MAG: acetolactate synthase [Gammaproteobacteria bacterium]|nr:acetolactate synthase [Gammaproteobacteria bacterium]
MRMKLEALAVIACLFSGVAWPQNALVLQSDFGTLDGAVAAMKGVAVGVSPEIRIYDLTHEVPAFNIWEAALRLVQVAEYWPSGTVFVSVVDPGVGTHRKSIVLKTNSGHYFVTPDNGTLTFVATRLGIAEVREIDEAVNRRKNSENNYTFHGRDVYAYTGARLASGRISLEQVGRLLPAEVVTIPYEKARHEDGIVYGNVQTHDGTFGNLWTNVDRGTLGMLQLKIGDPVRVTILKGADVVLALTAPYVRTFGEVPVGAPLLYLNSLNNVSLAINQDSFAAHYQIESGHEWSIRLRR